MLYSIVINGKKPKQTTLKEIPNSSIDQLRIGPVNNTDEIREILGGWSKEFVDLCCGQYKQDEIVKFAVEWDK